MEPGAKITFELTNKQGAALVTKHPTYREHIERERRFENYIKRHYESWVEFAREQDYPEDVRPILVTGVDLTREFATVAYSGNEGRMECKFSAALSTASGSTWGSWDTPPVLVHTNCGPHPSRQSHSSTERPAPESEIPDEYNQCVFICYYTILKRLFFPAVLKAGAGPHQLPKGNHGDDDLGEEGLRALSIGDSTKDDYPETGSPGDVLDEVVHNVPTVGPNAIGAYRCSRTGPRMTAIALTLLRNLYSRSGPPFGNRLCEFTHFNRDPTRNPCYYITMTLKTFSKYYTPAFVPIPCSH